MYYILKLIVRDIFLLLELTASRLKYDNFDVKVTLTSKTSQFVYDILQLLLFHSFSRKVQSAF